MRVLLLSNRFYGPPYRAFFWRARIGTQFAGCIGQHGSIARIQCIHGCKRAVWNVDYDDVVLDEKQFVATKMLVCPHCGEMARPNILMFGDYGWLSDIEQAQHHFSRWFERVHLNNQQVVIVEIGAGVDLPSIRRLSESLAVHKNTQLIRINPRHYNVPASAMSIKAGGLEGIKSLFGDD